MRLEDGQTYPRFIEVRQLFHTDRSFRALEKLVQQKVMANAPVRERKYLEEDANIRTQKLLNEICEQVVAEEAAGNRLMDKEQIFGRARKMIEGMEIVRTSQVIRF